MQKWKNWSVTCGILPNLPSSITSFTLTEYKTNTWFDFQSACQTVGTQNWKGYKHAEVFFQSRIKQLNENKIRTTWKPSRNLLDCDPLYGNGYSLSCSNSRVRPVEQNAEPYAPTPSLLNVSIQFGSILNSKWRHNNFCFHSIVF
jgi:hypothetical protein